MTRVLDTARISNVDSVMFVDRKIREMVSFELGKEIKKDVFRLVTSVGQRKNFWVPMRNRSSDLRFLRSDPLSLSQRLHGKRFYKEVHMTRTLDTARISNVDSVMFVDIKIREMVSFELGKEIKKDIFRLFSSMGQRKNFWVPSRHPNLTSQNKRLKYWGNTVDDKNNV